MYQAISLLNLLWTQQFVSWTTDYLSLLLLLLLKYLSIALLCYVQKLVKSIKKYLL